MNKLVAREQYLIHLIKKKYLIPSPNHRGVKLAESTHRPPLTPILSLLNSGNRCQVQENVTFIEKNVEND